MQIYIYIYVYIYIYISARRQRKIESCCKAVLSESRCAVRKWSDGRGEEPLISRPSFVSFCFVLRPIAIVTLWP